MPDPSQLTLGAYKQGSYILVEDKADNPFFYIIKSGQVRVQTKSDLVVSSIVQSGGDNILKPGDFFGVISAMSGRPSIESVTALTDVIVIIVRRDQFGTLIEKNGPIAMKIIRTFSRQLRYFGTALTQLSFSSSVQEDPAHLLSLGEYYYKQKNWATAAYAYKKFLEHNSESAHATQAQQRLAQLAAYVKAEPDKTQAQVQAQGGGFARIYQDGDVVFLEHEVGNELFIIQHGSVKIKKVVAESEITLAILQKGDVFGEMAILDDMPRSATAAAYGKTMLLAINKDNFQGMVRQQPQLATKIITLLSERIWISYRQFSNAMLDEPNAKIFDVLLTQMIKENILPVRNVPHTFNFGPEELLGLIGVPHTKSKAIFADLFKSHPKLSLVNGKIHTSDLDEILRQATYYKNQWLRKRKIEEQRGNAG
jgi:CRP/FNR family transcriptional regulator